LITYNYHLNLSFPNNMPFIESTKPGYYFGAAACLPF